MSSAVKADEGDTGAHAIRRSERGAEVFAQARRHSRRVRLLKVVLPSVAVVVSILFFGYSLLSSSGLGPISFDATSLEGGDLVMHNPTLDGFTGENLPFSMTAARALQSVGDDTGAIRLEGISATLPIDGENRATINADGGVFDRENERLKLSDATVETTSGMVARLQSADVDIGSSDLSSDDPVEIEMEGMRLRADSFRALDGGKKLVFESRVRMNLDPQFAQRQGVRGE